MVEIPEKPAPGESITEKTTSPESMVVITEKST